jgi:hypothetical protein
MMNGIKYQVLLLNIMKRCPRSGSANKTTKMTFPARLGL